MQTLSYGFQNPETGDKGSLFFPALNANIQKLNDHTHNGMNSSLLTSSSIKAVTQSILAGAWVADGGGNFHQTVTMVGGLLFDDYFVMFKDASNRLLMLSCEKVTSNTYNVFVNNNTLNLTAVYLS